MVRRFRSIDEIPAASWDSIAGPAGLYETSDWLRAFEGAERNYPAAEATYVAVFRGPEIVAVAPCYRVRRELGRVPPALDVPSRHFGSGSPVDEASLHPFLVLGSPVGENRLLVRPDLPAGERALAVRRLSDDVRRLAAEEGARLIAIGSLPARDALELVRAAGSWLPVYAGADCHLTVPEGGFEGYLESSLKGHRPRKVRRDVRAFAEAGLTFEQRPFGEVIGEAVPLMVAADRKWGIELDGAWLERSFRRLDRFMAGRTRVLCARHPSGALVSWVCCFVHRGTWYCKFGGADDAGAPKKAAVYFNNVFYEPVRAAHAEGIRQIHYGRGSLATKVAHGCDVLPLVQLVSVPGGNEAAIRAHLGARSRAALGEERAELEAIGFDGARADQTLRVAEVRDVLEAGGIAA